MSRAVVTTALVVAFLVQGCARSVSRPSSVPTVPSRPFERVWVAGFVTGDRKDVDVNGTTVRLLRAELQRRGFEPIAGEPIALKSTDIFQDAAYWRRYWDEYRASVIVTGTMELKPAPPRVHQIRGRAAVYRIEPGFLLESHVVLIDGATGTVLASHRLPRQAAYGLGRRGSPEFLYFGMLYDVMPDLVEVVTGGSSATIGGRR